MINLSLNLMQALVTGVVLGAIFFGGLWLTVKKGIGSEWAWIWFLISLLLRASIVIAGFYYIGRGQSESLLVCLLGFVMARSIVTQLTKTAKASANLVEGAGDAS